MGLRLAFDPSAKRREQRLTLYVAIEDTRAMRGSCVGEHILRRFFDPQPSSVMEAAAILGEARSIWLVRQAEEVVPSPDGVLTYVPMAFEPPDGDDLELSARLDDAHLHNRPFCGQ